MFSFRQGLCQCRYMLLIRRFFCMIVNPAAYFSSIPTPIPAAVFGFQEALVLVWILYLIIRTSNYGQKAIKLERSVVFREIRIYDPCTGYAAGTVSVRAVCITAIGRFSG